MSTLNRTFGTRRHGAEAGAGAGDGDRTGPKDGTGAGARSGEAIAAGAGIGTGVRQQTLWHTPMARNCFEKTGQGVDHTLESSACIIHTVQTSPDCMPFHFTR